MPSAAFNNQNLFSDYYLESVFPGSPDWSSAEADAASAQALLRERWATGGQLVEHNEMQTEAHWIRPVLDALGFSYQVQPSVPDADGITRWPDYALFAADSDRSNAEDKHGTVEYFRRALAVADAKVWDAPLDRGRSGGPLADRRNPNFQIDAYLRETDQRWGVVTNGRLWRLYSRDTSYRLDSFYEVDLLMLLHGDLHDFMYFWQLFRRPSLQGQPDALVDRVRRESQTLAEQLSERVKDRVYAALNEFVNGFLAFPPNKLTPPDSLDAIYANSLILLYRLLFVLYGEAHELLPVRNQDYAETYGLTRIKQELASRLDAGAHLLPDADNYYADLTNLFQIIHSGGPELQVPHYNGGLFSDERHPFLATCRLGDAYLARGLDLLARVPSDNGLAFVDYTTLQIRHLGDIYEGLLEYHPRYADVDMAAIRSGGAEKWQPTAELKPNDRPTARAPAGTCYLATGHGERRATGSYYTPQEIVSAMVRDSLGRTIVKLEAEHDGEELVAGLLSLRVCDPAMGSGHFLVECVEQLARAIVRAGATKEHDEDNELLLAKRRVVEQCVFGVDPNPLAVELAKLSLWLATVARDRPLSFVDAHLVCGNSLIGTTVNQMSTLSGERGQQINLVEDALAQVLPTLLAKSTALSATVTATIADVEDKERLFHEVEELRSAFVRVADLWTAERFGLAVDEVAYLNVVAGLRGPGELPAGEVEMLKDAAELARRFRFFHWELAFPDVFLNDARGKGFDVVVTNPPYVSAIERGRAYTDWENDFWRSTLASARGAFDIYIPFMERALSLSCPGGWTSLITPNKFLAAPYARAFRELVVAQHELVKLVDGSGVPVFADPMVYPVISLYRAHHDDQGTVEVALLTEGYATTPLANHPGIALTLLPENIWSFLLLADAELLLRLAQRWPSLEGERGMRAVASTTTGEANSYGAEVREEHLAPTEGWRVVTTGTIRPFCGDWGISRLTQQRRHFVRPVLPYRAPPVSHNRRDLFWAGKLIFKKLALHLEAQLDAEGEYASMNTNFVLPGTVDIYSLAALLHSNVVNWIYEGYFGALRMGGGYMQVQAPQLRVLPIPTLGPARDEDEWATLEARFGDVTRFDLGEIDPANASDLLGLLGRNWARTAKAHYETRATLAFDLLTAFGLEGRRDAEPGFVLPRQAAILASVEERVDDLGRFWQPIRATARQLKLAITPAREASLTKAAQKAVPVFRDSAESTTALRERVDCASCLLFGLDNADVRRVSEGHRELAGITAELTAETP
jgi:hypothetical protein